MQLLNASNPHIRLLTRNFSECYYFYRDVLEFDLQYGKPDYGYAVFSKDGFILSLYPANDMAVLAGKDHLPVYVKSQDQLAIIFQVENVDDAVLKLEVKDILPDKPAADHIQWGIRTVYYRDPDGRLIEIFSKLEKNKDDDEYSAD